MKRREERKHKKLLRKSKKNWIVVGASVLTLGAVAGASVFSPDVEAQQISLEQAKEIAYEDAGINEEQISEIDDRELDDDGVYELEFSANGVEYEYNINADNGQIVEREGNSNQLRNQISQSSLVWTPRSVEEIENDLQGYETVEELGSYSIQWGDTLSAISQATGFSVNEIAETFGIQNPNLIIASYTFQEQADLEVNTVENPVSLVTGRLEEDDDIDDLDVEELDDAYEDTDDQDDDRDDVNEADDQDDDYDDVDETDDQDDDYDDVDEADDQDDDRDDVDEADDQDDDRDDVDEADDQNDDHDDVDEADDQNDDRDDVNETDDQDDTDGQTSESNQGAVTLEEAKAIAFKHAGVDGTNARFDDQELDDDGVYELEFVVDGVEYEYEIQASTGNIVGAERDGENVVASTRYGGSRDNATLTLEEAKAIAFEHAGVDGTNARFDDQELDDDGVFELEFTVNGIEYEYDIDAATGEIIEAERDGVDNNAATDDQDDDRYDDDADDQDDDRYDDDADDVDDQDDDRYDDDADDMDDQDDDRYDDDADDVDDQDDDRYDDDADDMDDQDDDRYDDDADDMDDQDDDRYDDDADDVDDQDDDYDDVDDQDDDQDDLEDDADDMYENDDYEDDLDD